MRQAATFEIDDVATLQTITDPLRMRILYAMCDEPKAVREIAEAFGVPVTRLYYHVHLLEDAGVIAVAETRKVGAMLERRYQAVAESFRPGPALAEAVTRDPEAARQALATILDGARLDAEAAVERHFADGDAGSLAGTVGRTFVELTPDQHEKWRARLSALMDEISADEPGGDATDRALYSLSILFLPAVAPFESPAP